jgi:hypothetical protein
MGFFYLTPRGMHEEPVYPAILVDFAFAGLADGTATFAIGADKVGRKISLSKRATLQAGDTCFDHVDKADSPSEVSKFSRLVV